MCIYNLFGRPFAMTKEVRRKTHSYPYRQFSHIHTDIDHFPRKHCVHTCVVLTKGGHYIFWQLYDREEFTESFVSSERLPSLYVSARRVRWQCHTYPNSSLTLLLKITFLNLSFDFFLPFFD